MPSYVNLKEQLTNLIKPTKTDIDLMQRVNEFNELNRRCQQTVLEIYANSFYKLGDKVEIIKERTFPKEHGWYVYSNLFKPGVPGEIVDMDIIRGQLCFYVKIQYLYYSRKSGPHNSVITHGTFIPDEYKDPNIWYTSLNAASFCLSDEWFKKITITK